MQHSTAVVQRDKLDLKRSRQGNELNINNMVQSQLSLTRVDRQTAGVLRAEENTQPPRFSVGP